MTTFLLIRHGLHLFGGDRIAGRTPEVHLSPAGVAQAEQLVTRLAGIELHGIHCSPLERTRETIAPLAAARRVEVTVSPALLEVDYGDWTGRPLDELRAVPEWERWNRFRSGSRVARGESMLEIQARIVAEMQRLAVERPADTLALVSHGDVIKAALAWFLGVPLDLFQRIEISPASVSVVRIADYGPWVLCVNSTGTLAELPVFAEGSL